MDRLIGRRTLLRALGAGTAVAVAGCQYATDLTEATDAADGGVTDDVSGVAGPEPLPDRVALETLTTDARWVTDLVFPPDHDLRYVATLGGLVFVHDGDGLRDEPLVNLSDEIQEGGEMGLLGLALHPGFAENRRLFVRYSAPRREGTPPDYHHTFVLSELAVDEGGTTAPLDSERPVLEIPQPDANHNSGDVLFGPDGFLYVPTGDGGGHDDTAHDHPDDWYDPIPGGNGQDTSEFLLGGVLRIDVDGETTEPPRTDPDAPDEWGGGYAIPEDNPLVGMEGHRDEYYAWGLRNPWRTSFDGENYVVADVCEDGWEKVYVVERGGNYGWNVKEGSHCLHVEECPDETPEDVRGGEPLLDPVVEYPNESPTEGEVNGIAVVGGHVYRGSALPALQGRYVFGDLVHHGRVFVGTPPDGPLEPGAAVPPQEPWETAIVGLPDDADEMVGQLLAFARDDAGELYVLGSEGVHRLVPA